jgi:hypothetical protein
VLEAEAEAESKALQVRKYILIDRTNIFLLYFYNHTMFTIKQPMEANYVSNGQNKCRRFVPRLPF